MQSYEKTRAEQNKSIYFYAECIQNYDKFHTLHSGTAPCGYGNGFNG